MKKKIIKLFISFCLVFSCLFMLFPQTINSVCAETQQYTDVLEDLQKDENFNAYSYPINNSDYSLKVITIAESEDKELFVYVYQPCWNAPQLHATSINISTTSSAISYQNYELQLLNGNSCFFKYKVKNFVVSTDTTRTYEISSIYRAWNETCDEDVDNDNTIDEVAFSVAKKWTFQTNADNPISIGCQDIELITILNKYVGFARYITSSGSSLDGNVDRHFVAFSTDRQIDKLMSADVFYKTQSYSYSLYQTLGVGSPSESYGSITSHVANLDYDNQVVVGQENGFLWWHSYTYTWSEIQSASSFLNEIDEDRTLYSNAIFYSSDETTVSSRSELLSCDWVLSFTETDYSVVEQTNVLEYVKYIDKTIVSDVSILRLEFVSDGVVYNLGVLDNKQTGSEFSVVSHNVTWHLTDLGKLIALLLILLILSPILPFIVKFFVWLVKGIIKIVTLPFKLIAESKNKKKNKGKKK